MLASQMEADPTLQAYAPQGDHAVVGAPPMGGGQLGAIYHTSSEMQQGSSSSITLSIAALMGNGTLFTQGLDHYLGAPEVGQAVTNCEEAQIPGSVANDIYDRLARNFLVQTYGPSLGVTGSELRNGAKIEVSPSERGTLMAQMQSSAMRGGLMRQAIMAELGDVPHQAYWNGVAQLDRPAVCDGTYIAVS